MNSCYPRATRRGLAMDWVKFDAELARDGSVDPVDKALYAAIGSFVDAETRESPSMEALDPNNVPPWVPTRKRLAECIGKSVDTVDRSTKRLEARGLLKVHRQPDPTNPRRMLPSEYELLDHHVWDERAAERAAARANRRLEGGRTDAATPGQTGAAPGRTDAASPGRTDAAVNDLQEGVGEGDEELAPSARSAADARRASAGSSAREAGSGFAATEKTRSGAEDGKPGQVPQQRGKGRKASPFPPELRERIYATEELLPPLLRGLLLEMFPYGHLPNENRKVIAQALEFRTPEQLGERAARRWITYGYDRDFYDGGIRNPLGVVEELVRPTPYCPDPECEDQTKPCVPCTERNARRARDYRAGRPVATHRPPRLYLHREECDVCQRPLPAEVPEDRRCGQCRTEMERANARLLGTPDDHETNQDDDPDAAYAPAPPNAEYRRQRERQAAAKGAPF